MSEENQKVKPKTDIELFLNNANQCDWKNDSGAGANAASSVDMTLASTDSLAEIVWSPDKGLSLKCADSSSSFADKYRSLFWDVEKSCYVVHAAPQSVTGGKSTPDKPIDDAFVKPIAFICAKSDAAAAATDIPLPTVHPISDSGVKHECKTYEETDIGSGGNEEKMNTADRMPNLPHDQDGSQAKDWEKNSGDQANNGTDKISDIEGNKLSAIAGQVGQRPFNNLLLQSDEPKPIMEQNPSPRRPSNEGIEVGTGKKAVVTDDDLQTVVEPIIEYKGSGAPGTNLTSSSRSPLGKLESSAENESRTVDCGAASAATCGVNVNEIKNKSQDNEMMPPCDKGLPVFHSPCNSRIHMTKNKGKEKSLSEGDANVRLSMDNDSDSSVESCNTAEFFSSGKKRHNFQQQLIIGSKRVKQNVEETSGSKPYIKQDSSFKNWISSMVKGLSQPIQNYSKTSTLTLANQGHHNLQSDDKLVTCKMKQDPEPKNTGFKSIFQSMYCPTLKNVGTTRMFHQDGNDDLETRNMVQGIDATPITCYGTGNVSRQYLQSNKFDASTGRYDAGPSQPNIKPLNFFNSQESSKNNPVENEDCSILGLSKEKEEMASHSSSTRQNTSNTENVDSGAPSERKETQNICPRRDALGSLWITRFSPKPTAPLIISDHLNERDGSQVHSSYHSKLPSSHKHISYLNQCKIEEPEEQPANDIEAFTGPKEDEGKSKYIFNTLSSSSGFTNSEQMASTFARRFGAMKHIIPINKAVRTSAVNMFCWFCGTRGHQLYDCSAISENELEDIQKNINSYGGLEQFPCICINCFQPNHWAISCPSSGLTRKPEFEVKTLADDCIASGKHLIPSNEGSARLQTREADQMLSGGTIHDGTSRQADQNLNLKRKLDDVITFNMESNASFKKYFGSSSNKFKEKPILSSSKLAERRISHVPERIYDAVKKLRLSRTDILKWINAPASVSQLDGFFLRLRLGKWEGGFGGTGYHVACINGVSTETESQSSKQNTRKPLSVKVGGIKCMVESHYISNHDFLEEEIMEWWKNILETGFEIPSEEDLITKFKKKQMLGL